MKHGPVPAAVILNQLGRGVAIGQGMRIIDGHSRM